MFKIGHISDLHLLNLNGARPWDFANKRMLGGANLILNRSQKHSLKAARRSIETIVEHDVDHICITGDLTNLALESEFNEAIRLISQVPDAERRVSVVPGNHDYYTKEAAQTNRFERFFAPYVQSDLEAYQLETGYPFCRIRGPIAVVGLKSAVPTPWFYATGEVSPRQLEAAKALLEDPLVRDKFKVVMIHHHLIPFEKSTIEHHRRLKNGAEVLKKLRLGKADLIIHGHNHHYSTTELPHFEGSGKVRVCDAGSASVQEYDDPRNGGKFNIYRVEDSTFTGIETYLYRPNRGAFVLWNEESFA